MKKLILCLFLSSQALADTAFVNASLGVFNSGKHSLAETKMFKIGIEEDLWYNFKQRFNGGFWIDNMGGGRSSSLYSSYQWGFNVKNDSLETGVYIGPGLISSPDVMLGDYFEFNETLYLGVCDRSGNSMGATYSHFSNAGFSSVNVGRDLIGLEIKFPF